MTDTETRNRDCLAAFTDAWASGDVEACLGCFAEEGTYAASVGPEPGSTFSGRAEIAAGIAEMLRHDAGTERVVDPPRVFGDLAVVTWTYWRGVGNARRGVRGCDIFTFSQGRILRKDAYRKTDLC